MWSKLFFVILAVFIIWLIYRQIKYNPKAFSKESFSKSLYVLGWLALLLIAFVGLLVLLLRA